MIEFEEAFGTDKPKIITPRMTEPFTFKDGYTVDETREKLLTELKTRLIKVSPDITTGQMACSIQDTLELSDEEFRIIIPEGSSDDHITDSFVRIWYMASVYPEKTFAQEMRVKHNHQSYETTEPASHLELILTEGMNPVLMEHYKIFRGDHFSKAEPAPLLPAR